MPRRGDAPWSARRASDPPEADYRADDPAGQETRIQWGSKSLTVRGLASSMALLAVLMFGGVVGANIYAGWRVETALNNSTARIESALTKNLRDVQDAASGTRAEHSSIRDAVNLNSCLQSLDKSEMRALRERWAGGSSLRAWCPWLQGFGP